MNKKIKNKDRKLQENNKAAINTTKLNRKKDRINNMKGTVFKQLNLQKKKVATTTFLKELKINNIAMI